MQSVTMREPELALSVWLPLAFARLIQQVQGALGGADVVSETSALLESFALPAMAAAARRDEADAATAQMVAGFERLAKRFGKVSNDEVNDGIN